MEEEPEISLSNALRRLIHKRFTAKVTGQQSKSDISNQFIPDSITRVDNEENEENEERNYLTGE